MRQPGLFEPQAPLTVSALTRHVRQLLESDEILQAAWVQGEISNFSRPSSGHVYFTLKDAGASLRCVIWRNAALKLRFAPSDGQMVEARGALSVYEAGGQYQLYVDSLAPLGEGALFAEFLRLKALLEEQGFFDADRKRPIPALPQRIGIVTSPTGAALRDMLQTLRRRLPLAEVVLAPAPVQGAEAPAAIAAALLALNRSVQPDVILLARGGGSIEDLWAFNSEVVVQAVVQSKAPVITGVGHETDFTLADFAADLRAPTPTAAAELATPVSLQDLGAELSAIRRSLAEFLSDDISRRQAALQTLQARLAFQSPLRRVQDERQRLDEISRRGISNLAHHLALRRERLRGLENRLLALNPQAVLGRGYALVTRAGTLVRSIAQVHPDDEVHVRVQSGEFDARVTGGQVQYGEK